MDSKDSTPETTLYATNQPGFVPPSYSSYNSDVDVGNHVLEVNNNKNTSDSSIYGSDGGSENEGFVSGEEEFETASERAIVLDPVEEIPEKADVGGVTNSCFVGYSDFSMPEGIRPVTRVSADDDDDNYVVGDSENGILEGKEVEEDGSNNFKPVGGDGSSGKLGIGAALLENKEGLVSVKSVEDENFGEQVNVSSLIDGKEATVEVSADGEDNELFEGEKMDESVASVVEGGLTPEKQEIGVFELKEEVVEEQKALLTGAGEIGAVERENTIQRGGINDESSLTLEPADDKSSEGDSVKFTRAGDSVIEAVHVNVFGPGVAVVGDDDAIRDYDT
ncbi:translocase, chloroplastic [Quillaja saponaria]|uniref:Translocase, chloroplastic n=1 Tax=Quillaja saponaria TaxID=32244 RepID=A0AAD7VHZ1_QUISA|nr:translocase, chloroplastic [Quillaja saponaria]